MKPTAHLHDRRGRLYLQLSQIDKATEDFAKAVKLDEKYIETYKKENIIFEHQSNEEQQLLALLKQKECDLAAKDKVILLYFSLPKNH